MPSHLYRANAEISEEQKIPLRDLIKILGLSSDLINDPCVDNNFNLWKCDSTKSVIEVLNLSYSPLKTMVKIPDSFSSLINLTSITFNYSYSPSLNFWNYLGNYTSLNSLYVYNVIDPLRASTVVNIPDSLETLILVSRGVVPPVLFQSHIKYLNISYYGFNYNSSLKLSQINPFMETLNIHISKPVIGLENLTNLKHLSIKMLYNIRLNFLDFSQLKNLETLTIKFDDFTDIQIDFPHSISACNKLTKLSIINNGFNLISPTDLISMSLTDFYVVNAPSLFNGSTFPAIIFSQKLDYFTVKKSGLKSFLFDIFSLANNINLDDNSIESSLPVGDYNSMVDLSIKNNRLYGSIPAEICSLHVKNINIGGNYLCGTVPDCYVQSPDLAQNSLLPNYFTNLGETNNTQSKCGSPPPPSGLKVSLSSNLKVNFAFVISILLFSIFLIN
ncbi:hypothetical protein CYY_009567 [Polysphondylium violaceum]|uniref:Leucine-rich repeat-containing protein n=1 Tax=Polysphondylium violaceum TaxID=133409 RepID=A0A8J4PL60_9MYCE|nr:hypothetical protein CYY_009567 [Polysphondylium violaceum]